METTDCGWGPRRYQGRPRQRRRTRVTRVVTTVTTATMRTRPRGKNDVRRRAEGRLAIERAPIVRRGAGGWGETSMAGREGATVAMEIGMGMGFVALIAVRARRSWGVAAAGMVGTMGTMGAAEVGLEATVAIMAVALVGPSEVAVAGVVVMVQGAARGATLPHPTAPRGVFWRPLLVRSTGSHHRPLRRTGGHGWPAGDPGRGQVWPRWLAIRGGVRRPATRRARCTRLFANRTCRLHHRLHVRAAAVAMAQVYQVVLATRGMRGAVEGRGQKRVMCEVMREVCVIIRGGSTRRSRLRFASRRSRPAAQWVARGE